MEQDVNDNLAQHRIAEGVQNVDENDEAEIDRLMAIAHDD